MDPQELKTEFLEIFRQKVTRDGSTAFLEWLERTDFFTAPASIISGSRIRLTGCWWIRSRVVPSGI